MTNINTQSMLSIGTLIHGGVYRIESYLASGGFGNTYVVRNIEFDEKYALKEFYIKGICQRDEDETSVSVSNAENAECFKQQLEKFKKEARRIRSLNNEHIVKVHDLFEENGTAYYVMDLVDGESLAAQLKRTKQPLTEAEVNKLLPQILDGLKAIHNMGIWHLDIKPANIMFDKNGVVKLIDFGASKQQSAAGGATASTGISYTNGYAPSEQMAQSYDKFGPWTDFYALGATLFKLLTNQDPPTFTDLSEDETEDKHIALPMPNVSEKMKKLVVWLMQANRLKRPKNVDEIRNVLNSPSSTDSDNDETKVYGSYQFSTDSKNDETMWVAESEEVLESKLAPSDNSSKSVMGKGKKVLLSIFSFSILCSAIYLVYAKVQRNKVIDNMVNNMVEIDMGGAKYSINKYEVTQEEWETVMGSVFYVPKTMKAQLGICLTRNRPGEESNPSICKGDFLPVDNVRWGDCKKFIQRLNQITGHHFRLPSTYEWIYAAKANTNMRYSGSDNLSDVAWAYENSNNTTHRIGTKAPNSWGLYDMSGNVMEWTEERDLCGGSFEDAEDDCKISEPTYKALPNKTCDAFIGFRLAE